MKLLKYEYIEVDNCDEYTIDTDNMGSLVVFRRWADGKISLDDVTSSYFDDIKLAVDDIKNGKYPINAKERR